MKKKHSKHSKHSNFVFLVITLFILLIIATIFFIKFKSNKKEQNAVLSNNNITETKTEETIDADNMPDKIGNYNVLGKIVIDKLEIEQYILDESNMESLELGVTKFYGPNLNEPGNFCIEGHNYQNIFGHLMNIEKEDTFYIIDKANSNKVTYKIYDKYTVYPDNLDSLNQETNDKREVTLITCTPGNLTRLIIKAREI